MIDNIVFFIIVLLLCDFSKVILDFLKFKDCHMRRNYYKLLDLK